jgi:hypothetical protein
MNETKIQFSDPELNLMCNAEVILTKNKIIQKVKTLLEAVQQRMIDEVAASHLKNNALFAIPSKISKGENYLGLPYLVLDYPRHFGQAQVFAIRSFFWWGHFFSSTLHLSGDHLLNIKEGLIEAYTLVSREHYFISTNDDPWQHHFEKDNYIEISSLSKEEYKMLIEKSPHIKIAAKWPLNNVHHAANELFKSWQFLLSITGLSHPGDEKDLSPGDPKAGSGL